MNEIEAIHTAARHFCLDRIAASEARLADWQPASIGGSAGSTLADGR